MASITQRNGSYLIMVSGGYDSFGKQIRKTMSYKPEPGMTARQIEKAVNEQAVLFEQKVLSGQVLDGTVTFRDFTERWCRDYACHLAPKTYVRYQSMLQRILPVIGHIRLDKLQPHHLMEFYTDLGTEANRHGICVLPTTTFRDAFRHTGWTMDFLSQVSSLSLNTVYGACKGKAVSEDTAHKLCDALGLHFDRAFQPSQPKKRLSNKTIQHHHRLISAILNQAVYWQVIAGNPAARVKLPKAERVEAKYLNEKQTLHLLELMEGESIEHRTMIQLLLFSGLRRGELCGLEWNDIDFEKHTITVCRSSQYIPGKGVFTKSTKTETSDRTITLPAQAFAGLKEYRAWQLTQRLKLGDRWIDTDRLFTQPDGKPIHPDSVSGYFRKFIAKTDLPHISIHSLRHTNISLQIAAGIPLRTVSYRAGHASTAVTGIVYSHVIRSSEEIAAQVLDDLLTPIPHTQTKRA